MEPTRRQPLTVMLLVDKIGTGGAASHLLQVLRHLDRSRWRPVVACVAGRAAREYDPPGHDLMIRQYRELGVPVEVLQLEHIYHPMYLGQWWHLLKLIRHYRVHVLHMYLFSSTLVGTAAALLMGVPVRVAARREFGAWWMTGTHHRAMKLCHMAHHAVTANSHEIAREVIELEQVPPSQVHLIYNGIDYEDLRRRIEAADTSDEFDGPTVGMVANLVPVKGHRYLLEAMPEVFARHGRARLVLVGDGPLKEDLVAQCERLGIAEKVHFVGRQPAAQWLGRFDVAVQSSTSEGGSNVVLEYMAAALPMVVPRVGANDELLRHRETAWLVPPRDVAAFAEGINALLDDAELAQRIGRQGHEEVAAKYTSEQMVRQMEALYDRLVGARG